MPSSRPWENWYRGPPRGREGENEAKGRYPEVLAEGSKRLTQWALKLLFPKETLVGIWLSRREKGRKEAGGAGTRSGSGSALEFRSGHVTQRPHVGQPSKLLGFREGLWGGAGCLGRRPRGSAMEEGWMGACRSSL